MYYACFADGMADFMPNEQTYFEADTVAELLAAIADECDAFDADENSTPYKHDLPPTAIAVLNSEGSADSLNWRVRISRDTDRVLDVIGMTEADYEEQAQ